MKRYVVAPLLGMLALLLMVTPASAGKAWCARDPSVRIDGTDVQIWVAIPEEFTPYVKDKVKVKIGAPKGLSRAVSFTDDGFNGYGEEVQWADLPPTQPGVKGMPLTVEVHVIVDQGKIDKAFGKGVQVPVQAIVNVGATTQTFEYGSTKNNKFSLTVSDDVDAVN